MRSLKICIHNCWSVSSLCLNIVLLQKLNWPPSPDKNEEENRRQMIPTLCNYFILDVDNDKELKNCHNEPYAKKLPKLKGWSKNIRSNQILNSISKWDETSIVSRNNLMLKAMAENTWKI